MREVAAEFRNPVMLYSIGKDSSVHAAPRAQGILSGQAAVPAAAHRYRLEISRDDRVPRRDRARLGLDLLVHTNEEGKARGINPITSGSALHTAVMKTEALKQALDRHGFDAAFGGARRDEEKSRAKERIFSFAAPSTAGTRKTSGPNCGGSTTRGCARASRCGSFRCRIGPSSTSGNTSLPKNIPVVPLYFAKQRPVVKRDGV